MKKDSMARKKYFFGTTLVLGAIVAAVSTFADNHNEAPNLEVDDTPLRADIKARTSLAPVIAKANESVVQIYTTTTVEQSLSPFLQDPTLRRFFGVPDMEMEPSEQRRSGLGSGVVISSNGYILTNNHVVDGADEIEVQLGNRTFEASIVGGDEKSDVAVLKIETDETLPAIVIGNSDTLEVGDMVLAIGNPFGVGQSVTSGIVSATGRDDLRISDYENFIQTDAAINPGNSGGALVDAQGRLVGINTAIFSRTGGNIGIGFAIPVNLARNVMDSVIEYGRVVRGYLGVSLQNLDEDMASIFGLDEPRGALITQVQEGTAADEAGLQSEDIVVAYEGRPIEDLEQLRLAVSQTLPNTQVTLDVFRDGNEKEITATLGELDEEQIAMSGFGGIPRREPDVGLEGVRLRDLDAETRSAIRAPRQLSGVLITEVRGRAAMDAGLREGDVIVAVNQTRVDSIKSLERTLERNEGDRILLRLWNQGSFRYAVYRGER